MKKCNTCDFCCKNEELPAQLGICQYDPPIWVDDQRGWQQPIIVLEVTNCRLHRPIKPVRH
jgi:hypothetical protein